MRGVDLTRDPDDCPLERQDPDEKNYHSPRKYVPVLLNCLKKARIQIDVVIVQPMIGFGRETSIKKEQTDLHASIQALTREL
jgi:hypothetical protein